MQERYNVDLVELSVLFGDFDFTDIIGDFTDIIGKGTGTYL
jgi:hypothetical protein